MLSFHKMIFRSLAVLLMLIGFYSQSATAQCPYGELDFVNSSGDPAFTFCEAEAINFAWVWPSAEDCNVDSLYIILTAPSFADTIVEQYFFQYMAPEVSTVEIVDITVILDNQDGTTDFINAGSFSINPNVDLEISASSNDICIGGSTTITVDFDIAGGDITVETDPQGEVIYEEFDIIGTSISIPIEPTEPTSYIITWDNGICSKDVLYTPNIIVVDSIELAISNNPICQGDSITIAVQNLQAGNYTWSGADIPLGYSGSEITFSPQFSQVVTVNYASPTAPFCGIFTQLQVQVYSPSNVIINPQNPTICSGQDVTLTANTQGNGISTWTDQYGNSFGTNAITVTGTDPFDIIYNYTDDNLCTYTDTINVSISDNNLPIAAFVTDVDISGSVCAESEISFINLSENATSYQWSFPDATPSSSTDQNPTISYSTVGTYYPELIVFGNCGGQYIESDTFSLEIQISNPVIFSTDSIYASTCVSETVLLNISDFNGPSVGYYTWSGALGFFDGNEIELTSSIPGIYEYFVTWTDSVCSQTVKYAVEFLDNPEFTIVDETICLGQDLNFSLNSLEPISFIEYGVNPSALQFSSTDSITLINPSISDIYYVNVNFINGCVSSTEFIPQILNPSIQISPENPNNCAGNPIALEAITGSSGNIWWTSLNDNSVVISNNEFLSLNLNETESYVAYFDNGFCVISDTVTATINENPVITIQQSIEEPCEGTTLSIIVDSFSDGDGTILWTYGPQDTVPAQNGNTTAFDITAIMGESLIINWQDGDSCSADTSFIIDVVPPPSLQINFFSDTTQVFCPGEQIALSASGLNNGQVVWTGACMSTPLSNVVIEFDACDESGWLYIESTDLDCPVQDSIYLNIESPSPLSIINTGSACEGDTVTYQATGGYNNNENYQWGFDGAYSYIETDNINGLIHFVPLSNGLLSLNYLAPTVCTPVSPTTTLVEIVPSNVPLQYTISEQTQILFSDSIEACVGDIIVLNNPDGSDEPLNWILCDGSEITEDDLMISSDTSKVCYIQATLTDETTCIFTRNVTIVFSEPELNNVEPEYIVCAGEDILFDFSEADSCVWMNTEFISDPESCSPTFNYDVNLTQQELLDYEFIIWQNSCARLYETQIRVFPEIIIQVPSDTMVCVGSLPFVELDNSICEELTWFPSITQGVNENTLYTLTAVCGDCTYEREVIVEVDENCSNCDAQSIPTAISPNADGINDRWEIGCPGADIRIVNRAGAPVYTRANYQNDFDGLNGTLSGTFYFTIVPADGSDSISGSITIIK